MTISMFSAAERRRSGTGGHVPGGKAVAWAAPVLTICAILAVARPAARAQESPSPAQTGGQPKAPEKGWIGMRRAELFKNLGRPSQMIEFPDTGGQMIIYARPGKRHYVFEIGPTGKVEKAVEVK